MSLSLSPYLVNHGNNMAVTSTLIRISATIDGKDGIHPGNSGICGALVDEFRQDVEELVVLLFGNLCSVTTSGSLGCSWTSRVLLMLFMGVCFRTLKKISNCFRTILSKKKQNPMISHVPTLEWLSYVFSLSVPRISSTEQGKAAP